MMKMKPLLVLSMIVAGLVPMAIASVIIAKHAGDSMSRSTTIGLGFDVENRKSNIEKQIKLYQGQAKIIGQSAAVNHAMASFSASFNKLPDLYNKMGLKKSDVAKDLRRFYEQGFLTELKNQGQEVNSSMLLPRSDAGVMAQYLYLSNNSNQAQDRNLLDTHGTRDPYGRTHNTQHAWFRDLLKEFNFSDIYLIEPEKGTIVYSVQKKIDFGIRLFDGTYQNSNLSRAARKALGATRGEVVVEDFHAYIPSYSKPAAFFATPIFRGSKLAGVLAFKMPAEQINASVTAKKNSWETRESLVLGSDLLMRTQSRFSDTNTILSKKVDYDAARKAIAGETGTLRSLYNGVEYLTAYAPLDIEQLDWVIMTHVQTEEALNSVSVLIKISLIVAACGALAVAIYAAGLGSYFFRVLGSDPKDMVRIARSITEGDLTDHVEDSNRTGAYGQLVGMRNHLRGVLLDVKAVAQSLSQGAAELSDGNRGLQERTLLQGTNIERTSVSTEELTSTVKHNADNARLAKSVAISTCERASSSSEVASRAISAMQEISSSSERIADIISVIDDIAFQTNLLALNAAVEAARAGEQGRGFAVVAGEVRQLAGRSASAAREIKGLIEDSVSQVKDGTGLVLESGDELKAIAKDVSELTDIVGQISGATDEQATGIEQINVALTHLDSVTQQNTVTVTETASTSETISEQAILLTRKIDHFKVS